MTKKSPFQANKHEIRYNLINATIAGGLVMLGGLSTGTFSLQACGFAIIAGLVVLLTKFKEYWDGEKGEYATKIFSFV